MNLLILSSLLSLLFLASGCSPKNLDGLYTFDSPQIRESLELKPEGKFTQYVIINGKTNSATGTWSMKGSRVVVLRNFLVRYDTVEEKPVPPQVSLRYEGYWDPKRKRLFFDVENEGKYFLSQKKRLSLAE